MSDELRRARRAYLRVGVLAPLALLGAALILNAMWLPQLPDPVAMHWNSRGEVDGTGARWTVLVQPLIGVLIVVTFAAVVLLSSRGGADGGTLQQRLARINAPEPETVPLAPGQWSNTARILGAIALGMGGMIAFLSITTSAVQRGLDDAMQAPDVGWAALWGFVTLGVLTALGWFLQPRVVSPHANATAPHAVALPASARAAWFGTASMTRAGRIAVGVSNVLVVAVAIVMVSRTPRNGDDAVGVWIVVVVAVLVIVASGATVVFRVHIGAHGVRVRSLWGWPNTHIALDDISRVDVATVHPFAEFGGWGWRTGLDGRRGVVMRTGPALQVTQRDGRIFVVTVDGADQAAQVLEGLRLQGNGEKE